MLVALAFDVCLQSVVGAKVPLASLAMELGRRLASRIPSLVLGFDPRRSGNAANALLVLVRYLMFGKTALCWEEEPTWLALDRLWAVD